MMKVKMDDSPLLRRGPKLFALALAVWISLELTLRITGFTLMIPSSQRNAIRPDDATKVRILAIGDSITSDLFSDREAGAWPRQLERELERRGISARVYNEGLGGSATAMMVSRLPDFLDLYHPQIVISMMGATDWESPLFDGSASAFSLSGLRTLKLARALGERLAAWSRCKLDSRLLPMQYESLIEPAVGMARTQPIQAVEARLRAKIANEKDLAIALNRVGVGLRGDPRLAPNAALSKAYSDRAFDLYPFNHDIAFYDLQAQRLNPPATRRKDLPRKLLECVPNVADDLLSLIVRSIPDDPELASFPVFRDRSLSVKNLSTSPTAHHYRLLNDILRRNGVKHIAMQYPTRPLDELEAYFAGPGGRIRQPYEGIVFVSNERNFADALETHRYEEVFIDRFQGSWGHATVFGHHLMMEALLDPLLAMLPAQT